MATVEETAAVIEVKVAEVEETVDATVVEVQDTEVITEEAAASVVEVIIDTPAV